MADVINTVPEREREVVVSENRGSNLGWVVLGIILLLAVLWLIGGAFGNGETNSTPNTNTNTNTETQTTPTPTTTPDTTTPTPN